MVSENVGYHAPLQSNFVWFDRLYTTDFLLAKAWFVYFTDYVLVLCILPRKRMLHTLFAGQYDLFQDFNIFSYYKRREKKSLKN